MGIKKHRWHLPGEHDQSDHNPHAGGISDYGGFDTKGMGNEGAQKSWSEMHGAITKDLAPTPYDKIPHEDRVTAKKEVEQRLYTRLGHDKVYQVYALNANPTIVNTHFADSLEEFATPREKSHLYDISEKAWSGKVTSEDFDRLESICEDIFEREPRAREQVGPFDERITDAVERCIRGDVQSWANTSADACRKAVGMQLAVQEEFGLDASTAHFSLEIVDRAEKTPEPMKDGYKSFVRAQYEETQEWLKDNGIEEVYAYRGMRLNEEGLANLGISKDQVYDADKGNLSSAVTDVDVASQPVSSYSVDYSIGQLFAERRMTEGPGEDEDTYCVMLASKVPAERILSTCRTGFGCLVEGEITVLGGESDSHVTVVYPFDDEYKHAPSRITYGPGLEQVMNEKEMKDTVSEGVEFKFHLPGEHDQSDHNPHNGGAGEGTHGKYGKSRVDGLSAKEALENQDVMDESMMADLEEYQTWNEETQPIYANNEQRMEAKKDIERNLSKRLSKDKEFVTHGLNNSQYARSAVKNLIKDMIIDGAFKGDREAYVTAEKFRIKVESLGDDVTKLSGDDIKGFEEFLGNYEGRGARFEEIVSNACRHEVKSLISKWAATSADNDTTAVAMQFAVEQEFGLDGVITDHIGKFPPPLPGQKGVVERAKEHLEVEGGALRAFARAQYEETQEWFREKGIEEVYVYRGQIGGVDKEAVREQGGMVYGEQEASLQPLSSFSTSLGIANDFRGGHGVVYGAAMPVERIFSTCRTGYGCLVEAEVVVLGGTDRYKVAEVVERGLNPDIVDFLEGGKKGLSEHYQFHLPGEHDQSDHNPHTGIADSQYGKIGVKGLSADKAREINAPVEEGMMKGIESAKDIYDLTDLPHEEYVSVKIDVNNRVRERVFEDPRFAENIDSTIAFEKDATPYIMSAARTPEDIQEAREVLDIEDDKERIDKMKDLVVKHHGEDAVDEIRDKVAESVVRGFIDTWADTSADASPKSIALQMAVVEEFGISDARVDHFDENTVERVKGLEEGQKEIARAFVRAQYEETQEWFRDNGIEEVVLYRGMKVRYDDFEDFGLPEPRHRDGGESAIVDLDLQPLSSYSLSPAIAQAFSYGMLIANRVPAERILSTCRTGSGCLGEMEMIVLGGSDTESFVVWGRDRDIRDANLRARLDDIENARKLSEVYTMHLPGEHDQSDHNPHNGAGGTHEEYGKTQTRDLSVSEAKENREKLDKSMMEGLSEENTPAKATSEERGIAKREIQRRLTERLKGDYNCLAASLDQDMLTRLGLRTFVGTMAEGAGEEERQMLENFSEELLKGDVSPENLEQVRQYCIDQDLGSKFDKMTGESMFDYTDDLVKTWAGTSADNSVKAVGMQMAVAEVFDIDGYTTDHFDERTMGQVGELQDKYKESFKSFVKAQYDETQEWFKERGIEEVYAYRGMMDDSVLKVYGDTEPRYGQQEVQLQPLSSFTTDPDIAIHFALGGEIYKEGDRGGHVYAAKIPVERVLSTCRTGVGCLVESEITVLGGTDEWRVSSFRSGDPIMDEGRVPQVDIESLLEGREGDLGLSENYYMHLPGEHDQSDHNPHMGGSSDYGKTTVKGLSVEEAQENREQMFDLMLEGLGEVDMNHPLLASHEQRAVAKQSIAKNLFKRIETDDNFKEFAKTLPEHQEIMSETLKEIGGEEAEALAHEMLYADDWNDPALMERGYEILREARGEEEVERVEREVYEEGVSVCIQQWAVTSADHSAKSVGMQLIVAEEFGLKDAVTDHFDQQTLDKARELPESEREAYRSVIRAQYEETQEWFKEKGVEEIYVYRGITVDPFTDELDVPPGGVGYHTESVSLQPLSSFAVDLDSAQLFAGMGAGNGKVYSAKIPVERIMSTSRTGMGCLTECEVTVLGGVDEWRSAHLSRGGLMSPATVNLADLLEGN